MQTKGDPKILKLYEPTDCWFAESFRGHGNHATKELAVKKLRKKQELKDAVGAAAPSTSAKTSVARTQLDNLLSPNE